jgi:hypothetical protein
MSNQHPKPTNSYPSLHHGSSRPNHHQALLCSSKQLHGFTMSTTQITKSTNRSQQHHGRTSCNHSRPQPPSHSKTQPPSLILSINSTS